MKKPLRLSRLTVGVLAIITTALGLAPSAHALYPRPKGEPIMQQVWSDLMFTHYEVDPQRLRKLVPYPLEIDTYQGKAYIGVVAFEMTEGRAPYVPFKLYSAFGQVNLRTYVKYKGRRGVYFFSLDADHLLSSAIANFAFDLPYRNTEIVHIPSERSDDGMPWTQSRHYNQPFEIRLTSYSEPKNYDPKSLEIWMTDLDLYFQVTHRECVASAQLWHEPFEMREATAKIYQPNLAYYSRDFGIKSRPSFHFVKRAVTYFWAPTEECPRY